MSYNNAINSSATGILTASSAGAITGTAVTQYNILVGSTSNGITSVAPSATSGNPLVSAGSSSNPIFSATPTVTSITISNTPSAATDGANKAYVDSIAAGFEFKSACYAATTGALTVTYSNGAAGIGATLTNAGTQVAFAVDGVSPPITSRILVKNQASTFQNGIYTLTVVGTGATNWILTRSLDYNTAAQIHVGDLVPVEFGTANANTIWLETATVTTIGTDPITFTQFSSGPITTTQYNVLVGGANNGVGSVAPSATSGVPLISQGSSSNPVFGTAVVAGGGTGAVTLTGLLVGNGTSAVTATAITQYNVITGGASNAPNSVAPSSTSGVPVISQGSSSQPIFGTAVVAGGGTGAVTLTGLLTGNGTSAVTATAITQYNILSAGASNAPNNIAPSATSGVPLISQGSSSQPIFGTAVVAGGGTGAVTLTGVLVGSGTSAVTATAITQYNVITGGASNAPNSVAPSATSGVPVISQGSSAQPVFGTAVVAGGGTGNTTATAYALQAGGTTSTGAHQSLATGSAGNVLLSGGSGALPNWNAYSGQLVLLSTQTASSSTTVDFANLITTTYDVFFLEFYAVIPATNSTQLQMRVGTGATPTYDAGNNYSAAGAQVLDTTAAVVAFNYTAGAIIALTSNATSSTTTHSISGSMRLYNLNSTTIEKYIIGQTNSFSTGNNWLGLSGKWSTSGTAVSSLRFLMASGNVASGTFKLYGVVN